jgi:hypothetical protein
MVTCRNKALGKERFLKYFKMFCKYDSVLLCSGEKVFQVYVELHDLLK